MYEVPEVHVLGNVSEMTLGRRIGYWEDGLPERYTIIPAHEDQLETEASA
jgi:hypothetical protein